MSPDSTSLRTIVNEILREDLRAALETDAQQRNLSLNDAAVRVLAREFRVRWQSSDGGYRASADRFKLRIPEHIHRAIRVRAAREEGTMRGVSLGILADHYGVEPIDLRRRPRRKKHGD